MAVKTYQDSKDKYLKEKVDTFVLRVPKGKKDEIMHYAKSKGMSLNGYITDLIFADMSGEKSEIKVKVQTKKPAEKTPAKPKAEPKPKKAEPIVEEKHEPEAKKKQMPSFLL